MYYEKYLKYKKKYLQLQNFLKGGDITIEEFNRRDIELFWNYAEMFKTNLIINLKIHGNKCDGNINNINLIGNGANGMTFSFECSDNTKYVVKFKYEQLQAYESLDLTIQQHKDILEERKIVYLDEIKKEFDSINIFKGCPYIIKAYNYFKYEPAEKAEGVYTIYDENGETEKIDVHISPYLEHYNEPQDLIRFPFHGGIILEPVQHPFKNIPKNLISITQLYQTYIIGLIFIHDKGYIHKDIKGDNLMFNILDFYEGKIIDLGEVYKYTEFTQPFTPSSVAYASNTYFTRLGDLTVNEASLNENQSEIKEIANKYDLYCLTKTFMDEEDFEDIIRQNEKLHRIMLKILELNNSYNLLFTRTKIDNILAELLKY